MNSKVVRRLEENIQTWKPKTNTWSCSLVEWLIQESIGQEQKITQAPIKPHNTDNVAKSDQDNSPRWKQDKKKTSNKCDVNSVLSSGHSTRHPASNKQRAYWWSTVATPWPRKPHIRTQRIIYHWTRLLFIQNLNKSVIRKKNAQGSEEIDCFAQQYLYLAEKIDVS
jgi:hypothetical protein